MVSHHTWWSNIVDLPNLNCSTPVEKTRCVWLTIGNKPTCHVQHKITKRNVPQSIIEVSATIESVVQNGNQDTTEIVQGFFHNALQLVMSLTVRRPYRPNLSRSAASIELASCQVKNANTDHSQTWSHPYQNGLCENVSLVVRRAHILLNDIFVSDPLSTSKNRALMCSTPVGMEIEFSHGLGS